MNPKSEFWEPSERTWSWLLEEMRDWRLDETSRISLSSCELDCAKSDREVELRLKTDMLLVEVVDYIYVWCGSG